MIRVLIVDDDKLARKGLISMMPWFSHGMEVVGEAANGAKALEFLKENPVDLMFVDLAMPVLSGINLIQQTRILYPELNFIILSFHEDFNYVQTSIRLGAIDYISKLQLELEDYDEIFDRIEQRMYSIHKQNILSNADNIKAAPVINNTPVIAINDQWTDLESEWRTLHWLFDDTLFEQLCTELVGSKMPIQYIMALLTPAIAKVEELTNIKTLPEFDIDTSQAAVNYVRSYRDFVHLRASQSDNLMETSICILKSVKFISEKIADPLHTDMVASHVNMSRSYFCQCFKSLVGQTFNEYLRQKRIQIAQQLLAQTSQTISWISQAVGYGDIKYFSHVFREQTNMLPSEYRYQFKQW